MQPCKVRRSTSCTDVCCGTRPCDVPQLHDAPCDTDHALERNRLREAKCNRARFGAVHRVPTCAAERDHVMFRNCMTPRATRTTRVREIGCARLNSCAMPLLDAETPPINMRSCVIHGAGANVQRRVAWSRCRAIVRRSARRNSVAPFDARNHVMQQHKE
jgi:hypothetical protein